MIPANLYSSIYLYSIIALTIITCSSLPSRFDHIYNKRNSSLIPALIICFIYAIWLGGRPISGYYFGDTSNYAKTYWLMQQGLISEINNGEWMWNNIMLYCSQYMDVSTFFTLIDLGYFGFTLVACRRLTPNNVLISLLFFFGALSFYSYGTNGIRNGLACSIILMMLSYITDKKNDKLIACGLAFIAIFIHHSSALPILMAVISLLYIKSFKWAYSFWLISILISLVAGNTIAVIFANLGFDDRLSYLTSMDEGVFSRTGFRWDFLIYSMMPIILGYYIIFKRGIRDHVYEFLLNTYTLSNAFWVMVIRANYSNRFAYLSWFMYPIVLAYPLLRINVWGDQQGLRTRQIMMAHIGFTWFMQTLYW